MASKNRNQTEFLSSLKQTVVSLTDAALAEARVIMSREAERRFSTIDISKVIDAARRSPFAPIDNSVIVAAWLGGFGLGMGNIRRMNITKIDDTHMTVETTYYAFPGTFTGTADWDPNTARLTGSNIIHPGAFKGKFCLPASGGYYELVYDGVGKTLIGTSYVGPLISPVTAFEWLIR